MSEYSIKRHFMFLTQLARDLQDKDPCRRGLDKECVTHNWNNRDRPCPQKRIQHLFKDS